MALERVYTADEAADILRITTTKLIRLSTGNTPKIAFIKEGRDRTFPESAIEAYIETNTTRAAPPNPWGLTDAAARRLRKTG